MEKNLPHFIGIGGVETGWQTLLPLLSAHPAICDNILVTNFFIKATTPAGLVTYKKQFSKAKDLVVGECSPAYLTSQTAPSRIAQSQPTTKLIALINHPLQRLVAEWQRLEANKLKSQSCYDFALKHQPVLLHGFYGEALTRYSLYYSPAQLQIIVYEDFIANPLSTVQQMYDFLGVQSDFVPWSLKSHLSINQELNTRSASQRLLKYFKSQLGSIGQLKLTPPPPLVQMFSATEITFLLDFYQSDITLVSNLLQRDLTLIWQ